MTNRVFIWLPNAARPFRNCNYNALNSDREFLEFAGSVDLPSVAISVSQ